MSEHEEEDAVEAYYRLNHPERYAEMKEKKATREQRRYEIARDMLPQCAEKHPQHLAVILAVQFADSLLDELDRTAK